MMTDQELNKGLLTLKVIWSAMLMSPLFATPVARIASTISAFMPSAALAPPLQRRSSRSRSSPEKAAPREQSTP